MQPDILAMLAGIGASSPPVDAVVPAHNEQRTIAAVIGALTRARSVRRVYVVADACTDQTAAQAIGAGAGVIRIDAHDKGTAMAAGLELVQGSRVAFIDADLEGLTGADVDALAAFPQAMTVGRRGGRAIFRAVKIPPIGGERVLPTDVAIAAQLAGSGYEAEMRLNSAAHRAGIEIIEVPMPDVVHPARIGLRRDTKRWSGVLRGLADYLRK